MKKLLAFALCFVFPLSVFAGDNGYKVAYDGGSLQNAKAGTSMKLYIDGANIKIMKDSADVVTIPAAAVRSSSSKTTTASRRSRFAPARCRMVSGWSRTA